MSTYIPQNLAELRALLDSGIKLRDIEFTQLDSLDGAFAFRELDYSGFASKDLSSINSISDCFISSNITDVSEVNFSNVKDFHQAFALSKIKRPPILTMRGPINVDGMFKCCNNLDFGFLDLLHEWNEDLEIENVQSMFTGSNIHHFATIDDMPIWYKKAVMKVIDSKLDFNNIDYIR